VIDRFWRKAAVHMQTASRDWSVGIRLGEGAPNRSVWGAATSMLRRHLWTSRRSTQLFSSRPSRTPP